MYSPPVAELRPGAKALIVGAGFGGLAAALRLLAKGYRVEVVDRLDGPGGRARTFERDGFRFDAGPTVLTAPHLFDELFALFGKRLSDYVELLPVTPWYRIRFHDGSHFDYGGTMEETLAEIGRLSPQDREGYRRLVKGAKALFDTGYVKYGDYPFDSIAKMVKVAPDLLKLGCHRSVYRYASSHLKDERLRQVFSLQPLLIGGNPFDTTCIYSLIQYLEREWGVWYARGGTSALVDAFVRLIKEEGGHVRCGTGVEKVRTSEGRVTGVRLDDGREEQADLVVANTDPAHLYRHMLDIERPKRWTPRKIDRLKYSMGLYVLYFATKGRYENLKHHTILMGPRYKGLLDDIFEGGKVPEDPSLYLHRPSATDPGICDPEHDVFYVLAPVPNKSFDNDWSVEGPKMRERVLDILERTEMPGLRERLVTHFDITPDYFASDLLAERGTGFSIAPLFTQSAWFRFHNKSEEAEGLYLVGAGTHPGAGVPGVLTSAKLLDRLVPAAERWAHAG